MPSQIVDRFWDPIKRIGSSDKTGLYWAFVASIFLLFVFGLLQFSGSQITNLPVRWLWVSASPILVVLLKNVMPVLLDRLQSVRKLRYGKATVEMDGIAEVGPGVSPKEQKALHAKELTSRQTSPDIEYLSAEQLSKEIQTTEGRKNVLQQEWGRYLKYDENNDNLFLVHFCERSKDPEEKYDVTIFLMRHMWNEDNQTRGFSDVDKAYFYFGKGWEDKVFQVVNRGEFVGVEVSAWGRFLATCLVTFKDEKQPRVLHRYIDWVAKAE